MAVEVVNAADFIEDLWREAQRGQGAPQLVEEPRVELLGIMPDAEGIIERAGRTCWLSHDKMSEGSAADFVRRLVAMNHGSVLEHSYAIFSIEGGSRAFTHQLVRHRLVSISQQSQRYVDESGFRYVMPPSVAKDTKAAALFRLFLGFSRVVYRALQAMGVKNEDARYVLPNAVESRIVIGANLREWRHILRERCYLNAQWEIKRICLRILDILRQEAPNVFADFELRADEQGEPYAFQIKTPAGKEDRH
jgi:thymidylate synthase (FAD)